MQRMESNKGTNRTCIKSTNICNTTLHYTRGYYMLPHHYCFSGTECCCRPVSLRITLCNSRNNPTMHLCTLAHLQLFYLFCRERSKHLSHKLQCSADFQLLKIWNMHSESVQRPSNGKSITTTYTIFDTELFCYLLKIITFSKPFLQYHGQHLCN